MCIEMTVVIAHLSLQGFYILRDSYLFEPRLTVFVLVTYDVAGYWWHYRTRTYALESIIEWVCRNNSSLCS